MFLFHPTTMENQIKGDKQVQGIIAVNRWLKDSKIIVSWF